METIGKHAGVSKFTVSIALRNKPGVSDKTREKIKQVARELGYKPNPMISALMHNLRQSKPTQGNINIAFLHSFANKNTWKEKHYAKELYSGVSARAQATGYNLSTLWANEPQLTPQRLQEIMQAQNVRA